MSGMKYYFDIDGVICTTDINHDYSNAQPYDDIINNINDLYQSGYTIVLYTARGMSTGLDWKELTQKQLNEWGVKYHQLLFGKQPYDLLIDDKVIHIENYRKTLPRKTGLIAGSFDILHHGYFQLFEDAKRMCNYLIVALHIDPSIDRPQKNKPIHTVEERIFHLKSIKYIDEVISYQTERDLDNIAQTHNIDIRIVGDDYISSPSKIYGKGKELYFHHRTGWSTTYLKRKILDQIKYSLN